MTKNEKIIFSLSTAIHSIFIGWFSYGVNYKIISLVSFLSCLFIMPIGYLIFNKIGQKLQKYKFIEETPKSKLSFVFISVETIFIFIFTITCISITISTYHFR